jgi:predicted ATPase
MPFPINITLNVSSFYNNTSVSVSLNSGLTVLVGANGSGKTQFLRSLKHTLYSYAAGRKVRYLSAGRLAYLDNFRLDYNGQRGGKPNYEEAQFGPSEYKNFRHNSEGAMGDFHTLSVRPDIQIKVSERLKKLFKRDIFIDWEGGYLRIKFNRVDVITNPYSSAREASGLLHLVAILSALYDDEVGALLIDEPEISLHPQLQSFLLREIKNTAGDPTDKRNKIVVLATHSTEFIEIKNASEITNIIFFQDTATPPKQLETSAQELNDTKLRTLVSRLGQMQKLAFFSSRPLLVEGQSDVIICSTLESKLNLYLGAAGSQIVPVIGKGQMPIVNRFFKLLGKHPVIITDLDSIADGIQLINSLRFGTEANDLAHQAGHESVIKMASVINNDFTTLVDTHWDNIKADAESHFYWRLKKSNEDERQAKRRSALAVILNKSNQYFSTLNNGDKWRSMKSRYESLLAILAKAGCFILKKGTIENYYFNSISTTLEDKPELAVEESERIETAPSQVVESQYSDVVAGLRFAAQVPNIDEAEALSLLLLSVAAPAISSLHSGRPTKQEIISLSRQILGERATLFDFDVEELESGTDGKKQQQIVAKINSAILDVEGFPIVFQQDTNPVIKVKNQIKQKPDD